MFFDLGIYVQGMNVLVVFFLYVVCSEVEVFIVFYQFLIKELFGYICGVMDGVYKGLVLVDKVFFIVDFKFSLYLFLKNLMVEIYVFFFVLMFCVCIFLFFEVFCFWDFFFVYGFYFNIFCIVVQLVMI